LQQRKADFKFRLAGISDDDARARLQESFRCRMAERAGAAGYHYDFVVKIHLNH